LLVVLYRCGACWSLILREEHKVRVFQKRVLRRIFGPKRDKVTREWRKVHNEELNDLHFSPNIVWVILRAMSWAGYVACTEESRGGYRVLVGNLRKRQHLEDPGIDGRIILNV
jgi:hypothetical protein